MKKTIRDYDLTNKKVIIRCDFNVPIKDGIIMDDTRIRASLKTIRYALSKGSKLILLSHLGKVKEESDLIKNNLYPVSVRLGELLGKNVLFSDDIKLRTYFIAKIFPFTLKDAAKTWFNSLLLDLLIVLLLWLMLSFRNIFLLVLNMLLCRKSLTLNREKERYCPNLGQGFVL